MSKPLIKTRNIFETAALLSLLFAAILLSTDRTYNAAVIDGIRLWAAAVLPALFPYLVITSFISALRITGKITAALSPFTERLFYVNGAVGYALFISLMSGYPVGAKTVSDLKRANLIGDAESERAAALCSSSSPVFLIGSVGNLTFNSPLFGLCLFLTHVLSVFIVGFVFSFYKRKEKPIKAPPLNASTSDNVLFDGVVSAVNSVLLVGGIITVFYLLTEMLTNLGVMKILSGFFGLFTENVALSSGIANGFFECTRGLKIIAGGGISLFTLPVSAAICGFGGISVIAQSVAYLNKAKIKTAPFLLSKTLAATVNFGIGIIFSLLFFS